MEKKKTATQTRSNCLTLPSQATAASREREIEKKETGNRPIAFRSDVSTIQCTLIVRIGVSTSERLKLLTDAGPG